MRKLIAGAAIAGLVMMGGGNAFAGELTVMVSRLRLPTPIRAAGWWPADLCLQRTGRRFRTGNPVTPGVVQSFGFLVAGLAQEAGGAGSFAHMIHDEGPGTYRHGFASGGGEE